jgi:hypothetical protein
MTREVTQIYDHVQWRDECDLIWYRVTNERAGWWSEQSSDSDSSQRKVTSIKEVEKVVIEGKKKGYNFDKIYELWSRIESYVAAIADVFQNID